MRLVLIQVILMTFSFQASYGQTASSNSNEIDFIREATGLKGKFFYTSNRSLYIVDIKSALDHDTIIPQILVLTPADKQQINLTLKTAATQQWPPNIFEKGIILSTDTLKKIFSSSASDGWKYFYDHYGKYIYSFSVPIFIRDYKYCLFYHEALCGEECASGELAVYETINGHWKKVRVIMTMIS